MLREHALPDTSLPVITATGMYALGAATHAGAPTLPHLCAAPPAIHLARLTEASRLLEH